MSNFSLILARGGSKGIPRKNLCLINGKPLIYYVITASLNSKADETWVSTDDDEIWEVAESFGAKVIRRPKTLATDFSKSEDALIHFAKNVEFSNLIFIQPTSPLLKSKDIDEGLIMLKEYDSIFSACKGHWLPKWEILDNKITPNFKLSDRPRRQDVAPFYLENGAFYITSKKRLLSSGLRYSGNIGIYDMPYHRSFQLDTYEDLMIIEALLKGISDEKINTDVGSLCGRK